MATNNSETGSSKRSRLDRALLETSTTMAPVRATSPAQRGRATRAGRAAAATAGAGAKAGARRRRFWNYPRAGKGPIARWQPSWRFMLGSFLLFIALGLGGFMLAFSQVKVPSPSEFATAQTSTVYYADGTTVMGKFAEVNRTIIDTTTLPAYIGQAVVASEDRSFYTNSGVDPKGIARALVNNLSGGAKQGASTLTQQYVKNYYVDTTDSYSGKFKQAIMALKIDASQSKEAILGSYLNTVYFGRGSYGIEAASQAFFGKPAAQMSVSEAALLAGILPAPSAWDPAVDAEQAQVRWARVLDFMAEDNYITTAQRAEATFPATIESANTETYAGPTGHLLQMVRNELKNTMGLTDTQIDTGGYTITTTINKTYQDAAVATVEGLPAGYSENLRVGLASIDPTTGGILALYGGKDYLTSQVNTATMAVAQAGSTYKPFAMVAALEKGATLSNTFNGSSPQTIGGHEFENFRGVSYGRVNLIRATQDSINTAYLRLNEAVGPEVTNEVAVRAGYPSDTLGMSETIGAVLGSASPHTLDIANAYATFAAQGTKHTAHIVHSVTNSAGAVAYTGPTEGSKVFSDDVMADTTYALTQVVRNGSGETAQQLGRPVAAKTGSSSDNKSAQFVGYTPQIATAVTLYQSGPNGEEESITPWGDYEEITGSTYPADLFTAYMAIALADQPVVEFPERTTASYRAGELGGSSVSQSEQNSWEEPASQAPEVTVTQAPAAPTEQPQETQAPQVVPTMEASSGSDSGDGGNINPPGNNQRSSTSSGR